MPVSIPSSRDISQLAERWIKITTKKFTRLCLHCQWEKKLGFVNDGDATVGRFYTFCGLTVWKFHDESKGSTLKFSLWDQDFTSGETAESLVAVFFEIKDAYSPTLTTWR
jgi:hypothetical protein